MKIFHLSNPKHGWMDITFGQEPDTYTFTASDVPNDCLRELAAAIARLMTFSAKETVKFSLEPEYVTCQLIRQADSLHILLHYPTQDNPVFEATFPLSAFAQRLRLELLKIEPFYSDGTSWTQPFPHQEVANFKI